MLPSDLKAIADAAFGRIQDRFPHLSMEVDRGHPHVDLLLTIPEQAGLPFKVTLNLQYDELHLNVGEFWLSWFPCTKSDVRDAYVEAVEGLLSGGFRILETYSGRRAVRAELQRPREGGWRTIGTTSLGWALPWRKSTRIVQNFAAVPSRPN